VNLDDCSTWVKAWNENFLDGSFFYREDDRVTARGCDHSHVKSLFMSVLDTFPDAVDVTFANRESSSAPWHRFYNPVDRSRLEKAIQAQTVLIFQDSRTMLFVNNPANDTSIFLNEYGYLLISSRSATYERICELHGYKRERPIQFISDLQHALYEPPDHQLSSALFIRSLGLVEVPMK
jgi:hypothetical protein